MTFLLFQFRTCWLGFLDWLILMMMMTTIPTWMGKNCLWFPRKESFKSNQTYQTSFLCQAFQEKDTNIIRTKLQHPIRDTVLVLAYQPNSLFL